MNANEIKAALRQAYYDMGRAISDRDQELLFGTILGGGEARAALAQRVIDAKAASIASLKAQLREAREKEQHG